MASPAASHTAATANTGQLARYTSPQPAVKRSRRPRQRVWPRRNRIALPQRKGASSTPPATMTPYSSACPVSEATFSAM